VFPWQNLPIDSSAVSGGNTAMFGSPAKAIVKKVAWIGYKHPTKGWQWAITVTCEVPPCEAKPHTGRKQP